MYVTATCWPRITRRPTDFEPASSTQLGFAQANLGREMRAFADRRFGDVGAVLLRARSTT